MARVIADFLGVGGHWYAKKNPLFEFFNKSVVCNAATLVRVSSGSMWALSCHVEAMTAVHSPNFSSIGSVWHCIKIQNEIIKNEVI